MQTIEQLLQNFNKEEQPKNPKTLKFVGTMGLDVYNPSEPFMYEGKELIIGRVEERDSEVSMSVFFEKQGDTYVKREDINPLPLQDPCITMIDGDYVIGGTFVTFENNQPKWFTKFYKGKNLKDLKTSVEAPLGMKDVRFIQLPDKRIGVFTRPQGMKGGRGKIGFRIAENFDEITTKFIDDAPLFNQFIDSEWGGANQLTMIDQNTIGVLGHIANFSEGNARHYYAMTFKVDIHTLKASPMRIIAVRKNFNPGPSKRDDLIDVLFSAALVKEKDDKYRLYVGVSDAEVQTIEVLNPFR